MWAIFASIFLVFLGIYILIGLLFALAFIFNGVTRVDATAKGASWGFRLLIFPGVVALWPVLLRMWFKQRKT